MNDPVVRTENRIPYHFPKAVALVVFNRLDCMQAQIDVLKQVTPPSLHHF